MSEEESIRRRFKLISGMLDERLRRYVAAAEALAIGRGGVSIVSRRTRRRKLASRPAAVIRPMIVPASQVTSIDEMNRFSVGGSGD